MLEPISLLSRCLIPSWRADGKSDYGGKLNAIGMNEKKKKRGKELLLMREKRQRLTSAKRLSLQRLEPDQSKPSLLLDSIDSAHVRTPIPRPCVN